MKQSTKLEKGGWTLSLRKMAIDVMDKMILRPVTILISDPRNGNINTFQGIRDKLMRKKYAYLANWKEDVMKVFAIARSSNDQLINDICTELEQFFNKKYSILEEFSEFKFKDVLSRVLGKEVSDETDNIIEKTEENVNNMDPNNEQTVVVQGSQNINESNEIKNDNDQNINILEFNVENNNNQIVQEIQKDDNPQETSNNFNDTPIAIEVQQENIINNQEPQNINIQEPQENQVNVIQEGKNEIQDLNM